MRDTYWDNLKALLIFLVVIGHFLFPIRFDGGRSVSAVCYYIYLFHMPAFIFVSGVFSRSYLKKQDYNRLAGFLVIYMGFVISLWGITRLMTASNDKIDFFTNNSPAWYLLTLCTMYLLLPALSRFRAGFILPVVLMTGLVIGLENSAGKFLSLSRTFVFMPFFMAGYFFDMNQVKDVNRRKKAAALFILLAIMLILFFRFDSFRPYLSVVYGDRSYKKLGFSSVQGLTIRFVWYLIAAAMLISVLWVVPHRKLPVTYIGSRTIGIYVCHRLIRELFTGIGLYHIYSTLPGEINLLMHLCISAVVVLICSHKMIDRFFQTILIFDYYGRL